MENKENTNISSKKSHGAINLKSCFSFALFEYRDQLRIRNNNFLRNKRSRMPITKKLSRDSMDLLKVKLWLTDEMIDEVKIKQNLATWKAEKMKHALKKRLGVQIQGLKAIQQELIERAENGEDELIVDMYEDKVINPRIPQEPQENAKTEAP